MKGKAVLFDLDGTLLNTLDDLADAMNGVLAGNGYPTHPIEAYQYFIGNGMANLVRRSLPPAAVSEETVSRYLAEFRAGYDRHWADKTRPYPGIRELLFLLRQNAIRTAVFSNKADDFTKLMVARFFPEGRFDAVEGAKPGVPLKPDPAGALAIAARMGLNPGDFVYVGDSGVDMQTARAAGMYPVGALWGFRTETELRDNGAEIVMKSPLDLKELFDS